jgi:hypothetical protein
MPDFGKPQAKHPQNPFRFPVSRIRNCYAPFSIGASTRLPHSVHEPS